MAEGEESSEGAANQAGRAFELKLMAHLRQLSYPTFLHVIFGPWGFVVGSVFILMFDFGMLLCALYRSYFSCFVRVLC